MKTALITGITGQDGSYLAELLLEKGYRVIGLVRRACSRKLTLPSSSRLLLEEGDLLDPYPIRSILRRFRPEEIYNLAAMSHVGSSFSLPEYTMEVNGVAVLRLLEAIRDITPESRFYQASTSELFGKVVETPQTEKTPFHPRSPYAVAKLAAFWFVKNYREAYGIYACNGILFNHESPRRGEQFVSRKISLGVANIASGSKDPIVLGNLDARRDWGYAAEFVEGMWRMLQEASPEDFVLATGKTHTVREFVEKAFFRIGIEMVWEGKGVLEVGRNRLTGEVLVTVSKDLFRPSEVAILQGDASKAKEKLGWKSVTELDDLVAMMVRADIGASA